MAIARNLFFPWLMTGVLLGTGMWLCLGAVIMFVAVADSQEWSVWKTTVLGVLTGLAITAVNITFGG